MIELRLDPRQLGLQRGALVDEALLEDGQCRSDGVRLERRSCRACGARQPLGELGKRAVERLDGRVDGDRVLAGDEPLDRLREISAWSTGIAGSNRSPSPASIAETGTPSDAARCAPAGDWRHDRHRAGHRGRDIVEPHPVRQVMHALGDQARDAESCRRTAAASGRGSPRRPRAWDRRAVPPRPRSTRRWLAGRGARSGATSITSRGPAGNAPHRRSRSARRRSSVRREDTRRQGAPDHPDCTAVPPSRSWVARSLRPDVLAR